MAWERWSQADSRLSGPSDVVASGADVGKQRRPRPGWQVEVRSGDWLCVSAGSLTWGDHVDGWIVGSGVEKGDGAPGASHASST